MKNLRIYVVALILLAAPPAFAQLDPFEDYSISDEIWDVTMVKVDANMGDYYLEGLENTWAAANEVAKELGHIEDYAIYASETMNSGDFNMILVVKYANDDQIAPNRERYDQFMEAWGEANRDTVEDRVMNLYPKIRSITGQQRMREITFD